MNFKRCSACGAKQPLKASQKVDEDGEDSITTSFERKEAFPLWISATLHVIQAFLVDLCASCGHCVAKHEHLIDVNEDYQVRRVSL